jgi:tripartite-type tricarboxylate transporter receptor subunit TctC
MIERTQMSARPWSYGALAALCLAALCHPGGPVVADTDSAAAFYRGRNLTVISGATPDGGDEQQDRIFSGMTIVARDGTVVPTAADTLTHLVARHLARHLPGAPSVSVVTLPGAGGRRAARHLAETAARDGSVIGALERGLAISAAPNVIGAAPNAYEWIGAFAPDTGLVILRGDAGLTGAGDLLTRELVVGAGAPQSESARLPRALNEALGTKFHVIGGYRGISALHHALERGEISGYVAGHADEAKVALVNWLQSGTAFAILQLGPRPLPWLPDVPLASDLAVDPAQAAALERIFAAQRIGLPYAAPPGIPAERLAALRAGFRAMAGDAAFLKEAASAGIATDSMDGAALAQLIASLEPSP